MKRAVALICCAIVTASCADDRVSFERGPLGPASYEVVVSARGNVGAQAERHRATLRVQPRTSGATLTLRTTEGEELTADLEVLGDGSVDLARVRGTSVVSSEQTELASLVGQLNPPLPGRPVRLGDRWSSTQRITTKTLSASLRTSLQMVGFRRMASTDAAELVGEVSGRLRVNGIARSLDGRLDGDTKIVWAVRAGRVVAADTNLVWSLSDGNRVTLQTSVRPR